MLKYVSRLYTECQEMYGNLIWQVLTDAARSWTSIMISKSPRTVQRVRLRLKRCLSSINMLTLHWLSAWRIPLTIQPHRTLSNKQCQSKAHVSMCHRSNNIEVKSDKRHYILQDNYFLIGAQGSYLALNIVQMVGKNNSSVSKQIISCLPFVQFSQLPKIQLYA